MNPDVFLTAVTENDKEFVMSMDKHVQETAYANRVLSKSGNVIWAGDQRIGTMSHCVLWDNMPFLNFLFIQEAYRGKGFGTQAVLLWEQEMKQQGYQMALLSTQADEQAQHLYRRLGYVDCGGLFLQGTPFDQPAELFFRKNL